MVRVGQLQEGLFTAAECQGSAEPVLMALNPEFYELIWQGRRRMSSAAGSWRAARCGGSCT